MLAETISNLNAVVQVAGIGLVSYGAYALWNVFDNTDNKLCDWRELKSLMGDGVSLSKNVRLSVKQSNNHICMIAPCESGKSRRFIMQNVNRLKNCSLIVTDPSGEIEKACNPIKKKYILNPFSNNTIGYDPLKNCHSEFEVRKIANVILTNGMNAYNKNNKNSNQQDWVSMATPLLTSYMLVNYHTKKYTFSDMIQNICTMNILPVVVEKDKDGKPTKILRSLQQEILDSGVESAIIEFLSFKQVVGAQETLSSIRIVMNSCLQLFLDRSVRKIFEKENIDIAKLRTEESVVYIQIPEHHADYFSPLIATFLTQIFDFMLENDGLETYFLFDEMANNGIINSICKILSTARKHNMSIIAAIQSLNQFFTVYGELEGKELIDLFKTIIVCNGLKDSAEYISTLLGTKKYKENDITKTEPLMTPDEVRRLRDNEILVICNNKRPVVDKMMDIVVG
jgi:type IV secretory pathway TraG/TraD family ATPase VirD4